MSLGKPYYLAGLAFLLLLCTIALAAAYGKGQTTTEISPHYYVTEPGDFETVLLVFPLLIAFAATTGGLGCIQPRIALPQIIRGSGAWALAAGIICHGIAPYRRFSGLQFELERFHEAQWIGFLGTVLILYSLFVNFFGLLRHSWKRRHNLAGSPSAWIGGTDTMTARVYALGGLMIILWMTVRISLWVLPWREPSWEGSSAVFASVMTYPITVALGAAALFLSVLQPAIRLAERVKLAGAILYFCGTAVFFFSLFEDMRRTRPWDSPIDWPAKAGLILLLAALLLNVIGMIRQREIPADHSATAAD